jgi:hypothetical protein
MPGDQLHVANCLAQFVAGSQWDAMPPEMPREGVRALLNLVCCEGRCGFAAVTGGSADLARIADGELRARYAPVPDAIDRVVVRGHPLMRRAHRPAECRDRAPPHREPAVHVGCAAVVVEAHDLALTEPREPRPTSGPRRRLRAVAAVPWPGTVGRAMPLLWLKTTLDMVKLTVKVEQEKQHCEDEYRADNIN